ncbi:MAG: serine protein kinase RIO [Thermoplasmatota archaeon]
MAKKDVYDIIHHKYDKKTKREALIVDAERFKTYDEVFDQQNLDNIYRLMKRGRITTVECPISTGKEANVYLAKTPEGDSAVKIFRTSTSTFGSYLEYIEGDRRFQRIDRSQRGIIYTWSRKEYLNLETMHEAGLRVPEPRSLFRNVLVMEYIGYEGKPAPQLKFLDAETDEWEEMWRTTLEYVRKLFLECELVHADLSEYNILYNGEPVYIDVGQSVDVDHPKAFELLERDLRIISTFFEKRGIKGAKEEAGLLKGELLEALEEEGD